MLIAQMLLLSFPDGACRGIFQSQAHFQKSGPDFVGELELFSIP